jgi:hypothetical protein
MKKIIAIAALLTPVLISSEPIIEPFSSANAGRLMQAQVPIPIRQIPGLQSLTFWERTGEVPIPNTFPVSSPQLETRLNELHLSSRDFTGASTEFYDVFYSNADGTVNRDGAYVTVEAVWNQALPTGGGLNIAEVQLNFVPGGKPPVFGNTVTSFVGLGDNFVPASVPNAVDGNLQTHTRMGNTVGQSQRLRITIGFPQPEPPPGPGVVILDAEVGEGDSGTTDAVFRVGVNGAPDSAVSVDFTTVNFGAAAGSDYQSRTGTLTIPAGQQSADITVPIIGDTMPERNQTFFVRLSNGRGAAITDGEAVGVILDDDDPEAVTVCSTDTPRDTDSGPSLVNVDRDIIISDLQVRMFLENRSGAAKRVSARLLDTNRIHTTLMNQLLVPNQSSIGTTCQPAPDFVISDGGAMRPDESEAPYVGQWRGTEHLIKFGRHGRNARGNWALDLLLDGMRLNCWCLSITGPREGLELQPARATVPVFENLEDPSGDGDIGSHYVTAKIFAHRDVFASIDGQDPAVTFRVRDSGGNVILADTVPIEFVIEVSPPLVMTRVVFGYLNWVPGQHTIEAEIRGAGVVYTDIARVTWTNPCAATASLQATADAEATLTAMRQFRDSKLATSKRGRAYSRLYYKLSSEVVPMMLLNPMMVLRSQELIERYMPVLRDMTEGRDVTLSQGDLDEIDGFLNYFAEQGSAELKQTVKGLCEDLRNPEVHNELGVRITPGARRELPGRNRLLGLKRAGELSALFGVFVGFALLVRSGRRKNSRAMLGLVLGLSVLSSQWPEVRVQGSEGGWQGKTAQAPDLSRLKAEARVKLPISSESNHSQAEAQALEYSTYLGGNGDDQGVAITTDAEGNLYVVGSTDSMNLPTMNAAQPAFGGGARDSFVAKLDSSGARLLYLTYLGGSAADTATGLAIDSSGNAYVTGFTDSKNFPTFNALQPNNRGRFNGFVTKLGPAGSLIYSTYLGGTASDSGSGIAVDSAGNVYVAGIATSANLPMVDPVQAGLAGLSDLFVAKLSASGNQLLYSTYLGGSQDDAATGIAVDTSGNAYVTGATLSADFRTVNANQANHGGGVFDGFVVKLDTSGNKLVYSTYLGGGGGDRGLRIAADATGSAYVTGDTRSTNFPTSSAMQRNLGGSSDVFAAKLGPGGSLAYSTYLGGAGIDGGTAIAVDSAGAAYITGYTDSSDFPLSAPLQRDFKGGVFDGFVAKLSPSGSALDYSSYLGGSRMDSGFAVAAATAGSAYVMGLTDSIDFPTVNALQGSNGGGAADLFIAKIRSGPAITEVSIQGKHLIVIGSGFKQGAAILLNGEPQKTQYQSETRLRGKKVGRKIGAGQTVRLQVRNPNGETSAEFSFRRPQ